MTTYQEQVVTDIHAELAERRQQRFAEFGPGFVDVILVSPDKHGRGRLGFSCEFACYQTYRSGESLIGFAQFCFGSGKLRKIGKNRWAVLKA